MVVEVDVAKLQARVSRLYQEGTRHNQERMADISRRARSPGNYTARSPGYYKAHSPGNSGVCLTCY